MNDFLSCAVGIPGGGVACLEGFISAGGIPKGGVAFLKDFLISAAGIPRGGVTFLEGVSYCFNRNP